MIHFETQSGSHYVVDELALTWERLFHAPESDHLRTEKGKFDVISPIRVGYTVTMVCPPINQKLPRYIQTTTVTKIWEE